MLTDGVVVGVYGVLFLDWNTTMQEGSEHKPFHAVCYSFRIQRETKLIVYRYGAGSGAWWDQYGRKIRCGGRMTFWMRLLLPKKAVKVGSFLSKTRHED
jgi:hypothetical protein